VPLLGRKVRSSVIWDDSGILPVKLLQFLRGQEVIIYPSFDPPQLDKGGRIVFPYVLADEKII
jgi:hypothetical protein